MDSIFFGKKLKKLRQKKNMTQADLAKLLSVSDKAISKWENGSGYPEVTQFPVISKIFGVSVDYLLRSEEKGIAIAGTFFVDIVNMIDKYPQKNMLASINSVSKAVGGGVPNVGIDLAKIDPDLFVSAYGKIANDENGAFILDTLRWYGLDTSGVSIANTSESTGCSYVMTEQKSGERTFFLNRGANRTFSQEDVNLDALDCEILLVSYLMLLDTLDSADDEYGTKMARFLHEIQQRGIKTAIDVVSTENDRFSEIVIASLKYTNYAILNETECCMVTHLNPRNEDGSLNVENIQKTMEFFIDCGVQDKVIIHCVEGGFLMNRDKSFVAVPSLELPEGFIKGSVGAGDAFAAGSLYGIYKGYTDQKILEFASCAAAQNLTAPDSVSGMKTQEEVKKLEELYPRRKTI